MRVLITGAGGFLGQALTAELLREGYLHRDGNHVAITSLLLVDQHRVDIDVYGNDHQIKIESKSGDLTQPGFVKAMMSDAPDAIFHLAASLTIEAERDDARAFELNIASLQDIVQNAKPSCRMIYTSSVAVFGDESPKRVDDSVRPQPKTTYGTHKAMAELMLADATRKAKVNARCIRLPIVLIRDATTAPTVSDRIAAILREPLQGRDATCGLLPDTPMAVASVTAVAKALVKLHAVPDSELPASRALNLASLTVTPAEMVAAVHRVNTGNQIGRVTFVPDAQLQAIVDGWPAELTSTLAFSLGIKADDSVDDIVQDYINRKAKAS